MKISLSNNDRALLKLGRSAQRRWERELRPLGSGWWAGGTRMTNLATSSGYSASPTSWPFELGGLLGSAGNLVAALPLALARAFGSMLSAISVPRFAIGSPSYRLAVTAAAVSITSAALAATAITKGYIDHPEPFWRDRISERIQSPIYGRDNTLIGSVGVLHSTLTPDQAREYAFIPLQGDLPQTYQQGLLKMENQHLLDGGWHNICGLDIATLKRWVVSAGAGGSTLSMQLTRELKQPEWGHEDYLVQRIWRKALEIGASCRLYKALGGDLALLKMYASYAPTFQGNGTTRGIEAASRIVFDVAPQDLTDAQQLILAASVRKPLNLLPLGATAISCKQVYPKIDNPLYEPETAKVNVARAIQCQILHRAIYRAPDVLQGHQLEIAIADLREYQEKGIIPANPFQPIPAKKLVNLASRTVAAMPQGLLAKIQQEADENSITPGEPLYVTLDAVQQHEFHVEMTQALDRIQRTPAMRKTLCLPLVSEKDKPINLPHCGAPHDEVKSADVLAVKVDVATGGLKVLYASSPLIMNSTQSIGSTAKLVIIVAALAEAYQPADLFCPRTANDGDRKLKRAAQPEFGFKSCEGGHHLMTWEHATATSDNLVFYELARKLGPQRLAAAATALGLGEAAASRNLAYELSFGTYGATPSELISASQALFSLAFGIKTTGHAPRALSNDSDEENPAVGAIKTLLPGQTQRDSLRQLLEAPVQDAVGTLSFLKGQVTAGKTGTVQSFVKAPNGRNYNHSKWSITFQQDKSAINLFFLASPLPTVPLAQHDLGAKALMPAHLQILNQE